MDNGLNNLMEELVIQKYNQILESMDCCKCEQCRLDVISCALNELPSKYVVSPKGKLFAKCSNLDHQFEASIITALTKAFHVVKRNPRHK